MASIDEEIRLDEEENRRELAFIRSQLPPTIKKFYSDKDILYMMDLIVDYYYTSGILESDDEEIDIDMEAVAAYVCKRAKDEGFCSSFNPQEVFFIVQADPMLFKKHWTPHILPDQEGDDQENRTEYDQCQKRQDKIHGTFNKLFIGTSGIFI